MEGEIQPVCYALMLAWCYPCVPTAFLHAFSLCSPSLFFSFLPAAHSLARSCSFFLSLPFVIFRQAVGYMNVV